MAAKIKPLLDLWPVPRREEPYDGRLSRTVLWGGDGFKPYSGLGLDEAKKKYFFPLPTQFIFVYAINYQFSIASSPFRDFEWRTLSTKCLAILRGNDL